MKSQQGVEGEQRHSLHLIIVSELAPHAAAAKPDMSLVDLRHCSMQPLSKD